FITGDSRELLHSIVRPRALSLAVIAGEVVSFFLLFYRLSPDIFFINEEITADRQNGTELISFSLVSTLFFLRFLLSFIFTCLLGVIWEWVVFTFCSYSPVAGEDGYDAGG
ncbi:unnamed protein product, partial [Tuber melanosporum]